MRAVLSTCHLYPQGANSTPLPAVAPKLPPDTAHVLQESPQGENQVPAAVGAEGGTGSSRAPGLLTPGMNENSKGAHSWAC